MNKIQCLPLKESESVGEDSKIKMFNYSIFSTSNCGSTWEKTPILILAG